MADFASSALAGYKLGSEIGTDIAAGNILRDVYAGQDISKLSPQEQSTDLQKASAIAKSRGLDSLGYSFQKQAQELQANVLENQLNDVKARQANLSLAGQLVQGATNEAGLTDAINSVQGLATNEKQILMGIVRSNLPFEEKQKRLQTMARTEEQNLRAQALVGSAQERQDRMDARDERLLKSRIDAKIRTGAELTPEEQNYFDYGITPWDSKRAAARGTVTTEVGAPKAVGADASSTGRGAAESGDDYSAVNKVSGAMGRYQIMPNTLASLRKIDPSLPKTDAEFLKDPAAQDKAMKLLEAEDRKSLKADGFKDSKVNLATYHRFGAPDGKKVLSAFEDNPSMPLKDALGEKRYNDIVAQNPDLAGKTVSQAITQNFGKGSTPAAKEPTTSDEKLMKQYDEKRGGGLTIKEWDTINPTAVQIGKEYKVKPTAMAGGSAEEKKSANAAYQVTKLAEDNAQFIKQHPEAVGTLAAIFKSVSGKTGNLADNVSADKRYTGAVAELGKRLFALGLKDAASSAGGRMNVYLEKSFAGLYDQSQSDRTLLRIIKARQEEAFNVLRDTYGADKENLDKSKYGLAFAPDADAYVTGGKSGKATADKPTVDINQFFFKKPEATQ